MSVIICALHKNVKEDKRNFASSALYVPKSMGKVIRMEPKKTIEHERKEFGRVLRLIRRAKRKTLEQTANEADIDTASLSRVERGQQGISNTKLINLSRSLGVPLSKIYALSEKQLSDEQLKNAINQLIRKNYSSTKNKEPASEINEESAAYHLSYYEHFPVNLVVIEPIPNTTQFKIKPDKNNPQPIFVPTEWVKEKNLNPDNLIAISIHERSMEPSLFEGDLLLIDLHDITPKDGKVYLLLLDGQIMVRRLHKKRGRWYATADNPDKQRFPDKELDEKYSKIIGRVIRKQSDEI